MSMTMQAHAIALAQQGWRVLPLRPKARIPKLSNWQQLATSDLDTVTNWWNQRPNANVGIATGYTFIVIDVDVKKGKHGLQSLSELRAAHKLPKTLTVKTPSGGLHLYYKHPHSSEPYPPTALPPFRPIKNIVDWKLSLFSNTKSGIDIRAEGGQVVAPGMEVSDFPGKPYEIVFDIPMADLPDSLVGLLPYRENDYDIPAHTEGSGTAQTQGHRLSAAQQTSDEPGSKALADDRYRDLPDHARLGSGSAGKSTELTNDQTAASLISTQAESEYSSIPESIPAGGRDDALFRFMCSWRERGYALAHAEVLAKELYLRLEQPDGDRISLSDVIAKLRRTYKTYKPSAQDMAAVQELKPETTLEELSATAAQVRVHPDDADHQDIVLEPQQAIQGIVEALTRFVLCIESNSVIDTTKHPAYANIKMESFKSAYGNVSLKTSSRANAKIVPLPKLWLGHTNRQTVDDYGYKPNGPKVYEHLGTRFFNKWAPSELYEEMKHATDSEKAGAGVGSSLGSSGGSDGAGNISIGSSDNIRATVEAEKLKPFWDHLDFLFDDDEAEKQAFWRWLAYSVRYPERRVAHGVLIVSEPGVGKSWFYKLLQRLLGVYEVNTAGNNELNSDFNGWVFGCSMVVIHELKTGNKQHMMQQLLSLITEERILINEKHKAARMRDIYANFLCFSNHANAAALSANDRRFLVYQSAASKAEPAYYRQLFQWLDTDGPLTLLKHIYSLDLSSFDPGEAPINTVTKARMEHTNMSIVEQVMKDAIEDHQGPFGADIVDATVVEKYLESVMDMDQKDRTRARIVLANLCPPLKQVRYRFEGGKRQYRLRAVRDGKRWSKAETAEVLQEFSKALGAANVPVKLVNQSGG